VVAAICDAVATNLDHLRKARRFKEVPLWEAQDEWLKRHHDAFDQQLQSALSSVPHG